MNGEGYDIVREALQLAGIDASMAAPRPRLGEDRDIIVLATDAPPEAVYRAILMHGRLDTRLKLGEWSVVGGSDGYVMFRDRTVHGDSLEL